MTSAEAHPSVRRTGRLSERQNDSGQPSASGTCPICLDDCNDPRLLACLHSACRGCIDRMAVTAGAGGEARKVKCPVCRTPCPITSQGASALLRNSIAPSKRRAKCDVCGSMEAKAWCSTCDVFVCNDHLAEHMLSTPGFTPTKADHFFTVFNTPEQASQAAGEKNATTMCPKHGQPLLYLCQRCDDPVCGGCVAVGPHVGHKVVKAFDVVAEKQAKVAEGVQKLRRDAEPRLVRSLENVDDVISQLGERADCVRDKIEAATLRAMEAVKLGALRLRQKVEDEEQSRTKALDGQRDGLQRQLEAVRGAANFGAEAAREREDDSGISLPLLVAVETRIAAICAEEIEEEPKHHPNPNLDFQPAKEEDLAKKAVELIGEMLLYNASASHSTIRDGFSKKVITGEVVEAIIAVKDNQNTLVTSLRGATINTRWLSRADQSLEDIPVEVSQTDTPGEYRLTTQPTVCGEYTLEVSINRVAMTQPITIIIAPLLTSFDPNECHETITLSEDRRKATKTRGGSGHVSVLGLQGMRCGRHSWKIRIGAVLSWHCVGVVAKPLPNKEANQGASYSWMSTGSTAGAGHDNRRRMPWQSNDCLQLQLDCDHHTLEMVNLRSNESRIITGLPDTELFAYANMYNEGNSVSFE